MGRGWKTADRDAADSNLDLDEPTESMSQAKTEFLGRISHELRTPLNSILGFAQLLRVDPSNGLSASQKKKIENIEKAGWYLLHLVNDLLDLTSIKNEKIEINFAALPVCDIIVASIEVIEPIAKQREVSVRMGVDPDCGGDPVVWADPLRLKQVLLNLLSNAVQYNRAAGEVRVVVGFCDPDMVRITVTDTGCGIPQSKQTTIFEPFTRAAVDPLSEGTGIGLALVHELVMLMGGHVGMTSQVGQGSSFWIELQRSSENESVPPKETGGASCDEAGLAERPEDCLVLYIEDNPLHAELVDGILSQMKGISLISANTPRLGLELARTSRPSLILLDLCLPGINGYEVLDLLQEDSGTRDIPVIALSANAIPADVEDALRYGFRRFLTKPVDIREFKSAVLEVLNDTACE